LWSVGSGGVVFCGCEGGVAGVRPLTGWRQWRCRAASGLRRVCVWHPSRQASGIWSGAGSGAQRMRTLRPPPSPSPRRGREARNGSVGIGGGGVGWVVPPQAGSPMARRREGRIGTCQWHVTRSDWPEPQGGGQGVFRLSRAFGNRGAAAWAGAVTRLPGAGRRGPICRGTNRARTGSRRWGWGLGGRKSRGEPRPTAA